MNSSKRVLAKTLTSFLFLFSTGDKAVSFGTYDIARSLTIPGWIVITALSLTVISGAIYLIRKFHGKSKLK